MNPAFLIHMATAYSMATACIKATAKGHEANSISYLVLEIKRNLCLFCVWFSDQLISRNIWLKAPFVYHCIIHDRVKQKTLAGRLQDYPQDNPPGTIHPPIIHSGILDSLRNRSRDQHNDLYYHRVPVPFGDQHLGQWASPPPPPRKTHKK